MSNCQVEEDTVREENQINAIYKDETARYLEELKLKATKKQLDKIEELSAEIDMNTLKFYNLKSTQKVLIVDVKSLNGLETSNKIKTLFFLIENKIIRSRIVTFSDKIPLNDYNKMILSILDNNKDKNQYSGLISFYNPYQNKLLTDQFENGNLTENGILSLKISKNKTGKTNGCTDWYWVTNYSNGTQTSQYVYTTCNPCEEMAYKTTNDCGGGSGGGSSSGGTGGGPNFPYSPNTNDTYDYFSPEGEHIRFQFIGNIWKIILISLPEVVVKSVPESRPYLIFDWPQDQQKAYGEGFVFTYESETGIWEGVPATDQLIAEAIEDQIDDSKLDPCPKEVMQQLKNTTNTDIVNVLKKLGASSIYTVNMVMEPAATYAETQRISKNNYVIRVDRTSSTDGTKLFKATVLLHELIHAYFLSIVDEYYYNYNYPTNAPMSDFPELFEAYVKKTYPNPSDAQHKEMADKYVDAMASALQEYDANFTVPYQVYKDLAWGGLRDAPIFNTTFPLGSAERIRITNRYNAESTGHSIGDGTPHVQTPVGKPCN